MKLFAILLTSLALQGGGTGSIYHDGWTDFNKNGQKDVYEDSSQPLDARVEDLQILDRKMEWVVEPGEFEIMLGASSTDIRLRETVTVEVADVESASVAAVGDCK